MSDRKISQTTKNLMAARKLIENPEHWCKSTSARTEDGWPLPSPNHPQAFSFCAVGALRRVIRVETLLPNLPEWQRLDFVARITSVGPVYLNDHGTHQDVLNMFDRAIQLSVQQDHLEEEENETMNWKILALITAMTFASPMAFAQHHQGGHNGGHHQDHHQGHHSGHHGHHSSGHHHGHSGPHGGSRHWHHGRWWWAGGPWGIWCDPVLWATFGVCYY